MLNEILRSLTRRTAGVPGLARATRIDPVRRAHYIAPMAIREIIVLPDKQLRLVSKPVDTVDTRVRKLADDMLETMYDAPGIGLAGIQVAVPLRILAEEGLPRYRALQAEQVDLDAQNERMRREVRDLQREVEALRTDPGAIERIARDELGMVRPGEVIFQFSE